MMSTMTLQALLTQTHAWTGALALITFWLAGLSRKGSVCHRYAGRVFLLAMLTVVLSAVPLSWAHWTRGNHALAIFFFYLILLVSFSGLSAWRAIRYRSDLARYANRSFRIGAWILGLSGLAVSAYGVLHMLPILIAFGAIGPITAYQWLKLAYRGPSDAQWWLRSHYGAMLGIGMATHIAFLQIGLSRYLAGLGSPLITQLSWFGPLLFGLIAMAVLNRRFRRPQARRQPA